MADQDTPPPTITAIEIPLSIEWRIRYLDQLEIHGAYVSKEDINQKFLRSLPPSWSQIALIMRNKPDIDEIDIDDLYNNLRVYEDEMKKSSTSSSSTQNLAFLSSENTNSTNEVSTASGDFGMDGDDLEELDLRWQVAMLTVKSKKFIQRTEDIWTSRKMTYMEGVKSRIIVTMAGAMHKQLNLHLRHWYKKCLNVLNHLNVFNKNYDTEREKHNKAKLEIKGYEIALELWESRILGHEKNELAWGTTNEATIVKPKYVNETVVSKSKINRDEVIIEDWTSDDEDDVYAIKTISSVKLNLT
ncbi:hypothetical protein Tco_1105470 [Tanacetum coccineum]